MPDEQFGMSLGEVEREHIITTVQGCDGNRTRAARMLQISIRSLRMKLHQYLGDGHDVRYAAKSHGRVFQWGDPVH